MYKFRERAREFRKKEKVAKAMEANGVDADFARELLAMTQSPGALLSFVAEQPLKDEAARIVSRMLELQDLSKANAFKWAHQVVSPWIWETVSAAEIEKAFASVGKVFSRGEARNRAEKEVRRALETLAPTDS